MRVLLSAGVLAALMGCQPAEPPAPQLTPEQQRIQYLTQQADNGGPQHWWVLFQALEEYGRPELARTWLQRASDAGFGLAQFELGSRYMDDDPERAWPLIRAAANNDVGAAQTLLGLEFRHHGQNEKAIAYFQSAAAAGDPRALVELANAAMTGEVEGGLIQAEHYFKTAVELSSGPAPLAWQGLGDLYSMHPEIAGKSWASEAERYYVKAHQAGDGYSSYRLALLRRTRDPIGARDLLMTSVERGHPAGAFLMGHIFESGEHVTADPVAAMQWYRIGMELGDPDSFVRMGTIIAEGLHGQTRNYDLAARLLFFAAQKNHPGGQYGVAQLYATGQGLQKNPEQAFNYYMKAAQQGHLNAIEAIIKLYRKGIDGFLDSDPRTANDWVRRYNELK